MYCKMRFLSISFNYVNDTIVTSVNYMLLTATCYGKAIPFFSYQMRNQLSTIIVLYPLCAFFSWTFPRDCSVWGLSLGWWMYLVPWGVRMRAGMKRIFGEFFFFIIIEWGNNFMGHLQAAYWKWLLRVHA